MKILTSSCTKIVVDGKRESGFLFSRNLNVKRPEVCVFFSKKAVSNVRFLRLVSVTHRGICPISASSSISPAPEADLEIAEEGNQEKYQSKTIHVKFQLQKECMFEEQFFIVGDEPMFGLWDPESAIPLNWSDGHVWTVELDIPIGKPIQYKFILKGSTGNILWQPGPNRVFKPWETLETIIVCEDWEDNELQKIMEEAATVPGEERISPQEEFMTTANKNMLIEEGILDNNGRSVTANNPESTNTERSLVTHEGELVLVPGLTSLSVMSAEAIQDEDERRITIDGSVDSSQVKSSNFPEFDEKHQSDDDDPHQEGMTGTFSDGDGQPANETEKLPSAKEQQLDSKPLGHNVLQNDINWGRKALQKLLTSIGLLKLR